MKTYRAVLFDLFGTVALFNREKLPLFAWEGQMSRSTMGALRAVYEQKVPAVPFSQFFTTLAEVSRELGDERTRSMREFSSAQRFARTLVRVGLHDSSDTRRLAEELSLAHMALLAGATEVPLAHAEFLKQVRRAYSLGLVSNFDHGPTARQVLRAGGVEVLFHHIAISDEHGWRKPHPQIFADTLTALGVEAQDALFVGDSPHDDVVGAKTVGINIAWVNADDATLPAGIPAPDYTVRAIPELWSLLFP